MFQYVCSLGESCFTATAIQRNGLKKMSFPFDWIFIDHNNLVDCLETNFEVFLDKDNYRKTTNNKCEHVVYKHRYGPMFNHVNPTDDTTYYYYTRCVERFQRLRVSSCSKLFIRAFQNLDTISDELRREVEAFHEAFSKHTGNFSLLCILNVSEKGENAHVFKRNGTLDLLELHTVSKSNGIAFEQESDNVYLDSIIKSHYEFNLSPSI